VLNIVRWVAVVGLVILAAVIVREKLSGGSSGPTGYAVQQMVGAGSCQRSGYDMRNRLDGSTTGLYDCWKSGKGYFCVTVDHGLARNVTVEARALFADTLGATKPDCARG
jgi:hypothetical protein